MWWAHVRLSQCLTILMLLYLTQTGLMTHGAASLFFSNKSEIQSRSPYMAAFIFFFSLVSPASSQWHWGTVIWILTSGCILGKSRTHLSRWSCWTGPWEHVSRNQLGSFPFEPFKDWGLSCDLVPAATDSSLSPQTHVMVHMFHECLTVKLGSKNEHLKLQRNPGDYTTGPYVWWCVYV